MEELQKLLLEKERKCEIQKRNTVPTAKGVFCPIEWDKAYCWPNVPAGTLYKIPCPSYIHKFVRNAYATKYCTEDGTWWKNSDNVSWTNYSMCIKWDTSDTDNANLKNVDCKIFTSFWHYSMMANYCWILMEGLYLHKLVFQAMFTDTSGILKYIFMGWGLPVPFIISWVVVRVMLEDTLCWTTHENQAYFWIIRAPITAFIVVNFFFFINITRVLYLKMFSQTSQVRRYRYRKWFKSTLVLVPLFGVHYALLLGMSLAADVSRIVEIVWLYTDQFFSSFQGFFVALLYCFCNSEVQQEIKKIWQRWQLAQERLGRTQSLFTNSLSFLSRGRNSIQSLHSCAERKNGYRPVTPASKQRCRESKQENQLFKLFPDSPVEGNGCSALGKKRLQACDELWREEYSCQVSSQFGHDKDGRTSKRPEELEMTTLKIVDTAVNIKREGSECQNFKEKRINSSENTKVDKNGEVKNVEELEIKFDKSGTDKDVEEDTNNATPEDIQHRESEMNETPLDSVPDEAQLSPSTISKEVM
ncbi:parathyroid hormone/parathyroid hormone-related peptide receptor-like isoform X2 [Tachypleus tridentatus]|uniref:parathyroid hormone/parathyroid hormone-related peptide receptor-like isoform X2 n=1 Tax=Tachypleus tridentatus TaxID=6853 RepID=UPI003FD074FE